MIEPIVTRCGYRCDLCLAYGPNVAAHPENRQILSDGWHRYFGFRIPPAEISCDGCTAEDPELIDNGCPVRPCAMERGLDNCSQCEDAVCEKLETRIVTREEVRERVGHEIPAEDYERFIRPYENAIRLEALGRSPTRGEGE